MLIDILFLFLVSLTPLFWLSGGNSIFGYDSGFRLNGINHLTALFNNWNYTVNYGYDWSIYRAFSVIQLPEAVIYSLSQSLTFTQTIIFILWFLVTGLSMYIFLRTVFSDYKYRFFWLFSSVFYVYNFLTLHWWLNAERATFSLYAALPIAVLLLYRQAFQQIKPISGALLFGLLYGIFNGGGSPPLYGGTLVTLILAAGIFSIVIWRSKGAHELLKLVGVYGMYIFSFLIFNAYWVLPIIGLAQYSYGSSVAAQGGIGGLIEWEKVFSSHASFINLFRLQGFVDWYSGSHPYSQPFLTNPILVVVSIIPIVIVILGFGIFRKSDAHYRHLKTFLFVLMIVGALMTAGSHPPTGEFYVLAMRYIPGFAIFRSSFYKFAPSLWFPTIVLSGYYLTLLIAKYINDIKVKKIIWVTCILGILLYHYPFHSTKSFSIPFGFTTRVKIPEYVFEMKEDIERTTTPDDRILIFPDLDTGYISLPMDAYTWGFFSADILPRVMTERSFLAGDANDDAITRMIYESIYSGDNDLLHKLVPLAGLTHILWRGDIKLSDSASIKYTIPELDNKISNISGTTLVSEKSPWKLYKIDKPARSMVYVSNNPVYSSGATKGDVLFAENTSVVRSRPVSDYSNQEIIGAECIMCDRDEFKKFESGIYLPPVETALKKKIKQIVGYIFPTRNQLGSGGEQIDEKLSQVMSQLSLYIESNKEHNPQFISELIGDINRLFRGLSDRSQVIYANRLYAYVLAMERLTTDTGAYGDLSTVILPLKINITSHIFMTDDDTIRYVVDLPVDGTYRIAGSERLNHVTLDNKAISSSSIILKRGFHKIEVSRKDFDNTPLLFLLNESGINGESHDIAYRRTSPTKYEGFIQNDLSQASVIVFNQRFDPRWHLDLIAENGNRQQIREHFEANGYANGWLVKNEINGKFEISYKTQKYGIIGSSISFTALVGAIIWGFIIIYKSKKHTVTEHEVTKNYN